ncbi:hypothetical protein M434DRAFT_395319 [Hypoxylon sp. CO27-5]|nr:hypothetical protein M434DRAFT_395319 [Hypoxylon sp. CO27-5]
MSACPSSTLCDRCNAVLFDDSRMGGFATKGNDGQEILELGREGGVVRELPTDFILVDTYPSLPSLSKSAKAGCVFCEFLKTTVVREAIKVVLGKGFDLSAFDGIEFSVKYIWQANIDVEKVPAAKGLRALVIDSCLLHNEGMNYEVTVACSIESTPGPCASWLRLSSYEPGYILGPTTVSWIQEKLKSSDTQSTTDELSDNAFLPTRLVRVDCQPIRLIETSNGRSRITKTQSFKYAALSYCWGSPEQAKSQLKTERASLPTRLSSIEAHEMTRVLQDAIQTCRALSIPYLWIDALCIIQDDLKDWERESELLGDTFYNAHVTICAMSSESCNEGFLDRQLAQVEIPFQSNLRPEIRGSYNLRPWGRPSFRYNDIDADFNNSKWVNRGWVFQEMFMSRRRLAFGKSKVHFLSLKEYQTQGEQTIDRSYDFNITTLAQANENDKEYYDERWHNSIIPIYSAGLLTYKNDRFPALSSIAQRFSRLMNDEYTAGLWKRTLYKGMLWACIHETPHTLEALLGQLSDSSGYVAPSWSWASRHGYVEFGSKSFSTYHVDSVGGFRREYRHVEANIVLSGTDKFGQINEASLSITTYIRLLPTDMHYVEDDAWNGVDVGEPEAPSARCNLDWHPGIPFEPKREVMMLLLGSAGVGSSEDITWVYGLLIHPVADTDKFFRVGIFYSSSSNGWGPRLFEGCPLQTVTLI